MKLQNMFGVVLWSDSAAQKAVIWCEDQGDLAFYTPGDGSIHDAPSLDAGDLIQFDMSIQKNVRKATNPQLLMQSHSPDLPKKLRQEGQAASTPATPEGGDSKPAAVVELSSYFRQPQPQKLACNG